MSDRPTVSPAFLAEVFDALPGRLRRRLEQEPEVALGWSWRESTVEAGGDSMVTLRAPVITTLADVQCTCLLAPKCLHIAAVLRVLPVAESTPAAAVEVETTEPEAEELVLDAKQRDAVSQMWEAAAAVLDSGAGATGLVAEGELLRAIHSCRITGLHRLAAAALRMVERLRALHAQRSEFRLELLAEDLHETLRTCIALSGENGTPEWIGQARREYHPVGSLKISGILTEPVVAATGYAGVVTYFVDTRNRIWSLSDIAPGDTARCQSAYRAAAAIGDVSLPHLQIGRSAVLMQRATASKDGRLGTGQAVGAVVAGATSWTTEPLSALFSRSLDSQLDAIWANSERAAGFDLLFFRGKVIGARENALLIETDEGVLGCFSPSDHEALPYRDNLRLLGSVPNLNVLAVGRVQFDHPRSVSLLAVGPEGSSLPDMWRGRVNLGLDVLTRGHLPVATESSVVGELPIATTDATLPLDAIRRRLLQVVMGGSSTVSPVAWSGIERDESALTQAQLKTGAAALSAIRSSVTVGRTRSERRARLARSWLGASAYERAAMAYVQRRAWLR